MRIGIGYDVHRLVEGRKLIIGGVNIPHDMGLLGHSDADVLLHAICDALLGAAGLGDLGQHFSDLDAKYKDINSLKLLFHVGELLKNKNYSIHNIDTVVIAEAPKLSPFRELMIDNIVKTLGLKKNQVNLKATTEEGLGFTGKKEGIAAWAAVTINQL